MGDLTFWLLSLNLAVGPLGLIGIGALIGAGVTAAFNRVAA